MSATDLDTGTNGRVGYSILSSLDTRSLGSPPLFEIVTKDKVGIISVKRTLDYERIQQHVLYVRAQDNGSPPLKGNCVADVKKC